MTPHRFSSQHHSQLSNEHRRKVQPAREMIERMSPSSREICLDLGCGTGYITIPLSSLVKCVIALDVQLEMLKILVSKLKDHPTRVHPVQGDMSVIPLKDASVDRAILVNVTHEVEDRVSFIKEVERALKPGGVASVVDFHKKETSFGPPVEERIEEDEMISLFSAFKPIKRWSFEEFYQIEFQKG